jgi:hypothetical protein
MKFVFSSLIVFLAGCSYQIQKKAEPGTDVSRFGNTIGFQEVLNKVFTPKCVSCHKGFDNYTTVATVKEPASTPSEIVKPDYQSILSRVFSPSCIECHYSFANYNDVFKLKERMRFKVSNGLMPPPEEAPALTDEQKTLLLTWLDQGAPQLPSNNEVN